MTKVTERCAASQGEVVFLCDFSPPRSADPALLEPARQLDVDFICVAYNPGRSVRANSAMTAYAIKQHTGKEVIFNLATRDMNKLAVQSLLLGAQLLGLQNLVVLRGDELTERDLALTKAVHDFTPTQLIQAIQALNQGTDYRGLKLRTPTDLCVGASMDLSKGVEHEARLAYQKAQAGAQFFIAQAVYDTDLVQRFLERYAALAGGTPSQPIFFGLQILEKEGLIFGDVPQPMQEELERGRPGTDIALELLHRFVASGIRSIYLVPPILKGGLRDYGAAQRLLESFKVSSQ
ncbi:MAG: methylenetetrahydrofolate reductase [Dehalococcoidia bacterium]